MSRGRESRRWRAVCWRTGRVRARPLRLLCPAVPGSLGTRGPARHTALPPHCQYSGGRLWELWAQPYWRLRVLCPEVSEGGAASPGLGGAFALPPLTSCRLPHPRDAVCGQLQCQGGTAQPLLGSVRALHWATLDANGTQVNCSWVHLDLGSDVAQPLLSLPGTACGPGLVSSPAGKARWGGTSGPRPVVPGSHRPPASEAQTPRGVHVPTRHRVKSCFPRSLGFPICKSRVWPQLCWRECDLSSSSPRVRCASTIGASRWVSWEQRSVGASAMGMG